MKKIHEGCVSDAMWGLPCMLHEPVWKSWGRRFILLAFVCGLMMEGAFPTVSFAGACEDALAAGGCIVINTSSYWVIHSGQPTTFYSQSPVGGLDHTCAPMIVSQQQATLVQGEKYYGIASFKYYYEPRSKSWAQLPSVGGFFAAKESLYNQYVSASDYVMVIGDSSSIPYYTPPGVVYPNGCSDLCSGDSCYPDVPEDNSLGDPGGCD